MEQKHCNLSLKERKKLFGAYRLFFEYIDTSSEYLNRSTSVKFKEGFSKLFSSVL